MFASRLLHIALVVLLGAAWLPQAGAGAIHDADIFGAFTLAPNDDGSSGSVQIGFTLNFFGREYESLFVNNNGNVTFTAPLRTYTPFDLLSTPTPILAPFFADVDTRVARGSQATAGLVQYGTGTIGTYNAFGVNWIDVGYYSKRTDKLNSFQLIILDRSDTGKGNFDFELNFDEIAWEAGSASGGRNGLGGRSARSGWSNGLFDAYELLGSGVKGALIDGGPNALTAGSLGSSTPGQYVFQVRNGTLLRSGFVPEPATLALLGLGLLGVPLARRLG